VRNDFGKFWLGQTISTLGSSFTSFAFPLLIFKLTGSALNLAAIPALVPQEEIVTANGRLQAGYATAKVFGPLLAGLLILVMALPKLLLLDAASFLISAGSLLLVSTSFTTISDERTASMSLGQAIGEGLRYVLNHPIFRWMTLLLLLVNFILPTSSAELVFFAKHWFAASDTQIGLLYAGGSLGTVVFSLIAGRLRKRWSFGVLTLGALMMEGMFTALPAATHWYGVLLLMSSSRSVPTVWRKLPFPIDCLVASSPSSGF
jgi:hypothetical protein